ncbi:hypothetical protein ACLMJK_008108 [Lecanora helva]
MALDNGYPMAAQALPTPADTPYDNPSRAVSGSSPRQSFTSPFSNYSTAPYSLGEESVLPGHQGMTDQGEEKRYSIRDPRRLTPDLGISFVSQIHTLKKELEGRDAIVGSLEETLQQTATDNEHLKEELKAQRAEVRLVKHQMSSLEHDMLQALENIAKERDDAAESDIDSRKHLEISKKNIRSLEDETREMHRQWEEEKQAWESDKRKLESKVHVVEERLKTMVAEMLAVQSTGQNRPATVHDADEGTTDNRPVNGGDFRSSSRFSNGSVDDWYNKRDTIDFRASRMSGLHEMGGSQVSGLSLADELQMTEEDEDEDESQFREHSIYSPDALPEERPTVLRRYSDKKARKVMGFLGDNHATHAKPCEVQKSDQSESHIVQDYINLPGKPPPVVYVDTGTQHTPPPSPAVTTKQMEPVTEKSDEPMENAANQSRKRVAIPSIILEQPASFKSELSTEKSMVSTGSQTDDLSQSKSSTETAFDGVALPVTAFTEKMRSTSTQTIEDISKGPNSAGTRTTPAPLDVPVIAIHPPASRPPSSHNSVVLPPRTRNAGCQAAIEVPKNMTSTAMQTQEIRVDKRPVKIPPRLHPSSVATRAPSRTTEKRTSSVKPAPSGSPRRKKYTPPPPISVDDTKTAASDKTRALLKGSGSRAKIEPHSQPRLPQFGHTYPGGNEPGPVGDKLGGSSSGHQDEFEKIFIDFDIAKEDYRINFADDLSEDDEFSNPAPIRKTLSKVQNSWKLIPQPQNPSLETSELPNGKTEGEKGLSDNETTDLVEKDLPQSQSKISQLKSSENHRKASGHAKPPDIRRKALVSSGIAEHKSALDESGKELPTVPPPFPVPTRSSSRKIPLSASDGADSPTPHTTSFFTTRRGQDHTRPPIKRKILRKVQSAAAVPKAPERRPPPPPSVSASSTVPGSPRSVPNSRNQFILPHDKFAQLQSDAAQLPLTRSHAGEASIDSRQQVSVFDAIAQVMVGEWMWKYVRKRTSFGITENPQTEFELGQRGEGVNGGGSRHKRWVWLAPYEPAVIWSSKQPNSGPALLGKGGRKLMIQSVLDVKDDTPLPKSAGSQTAFDRSILILTPQRALKFTAVSRERHYIWLTALSFLSHSTDSINDLGTPPPIPQQEYQRPPSQEVNTGFRRAPVRDSIRIAKARSRPSTSGRSFSSPVGGLEQRIIQDTMVPFEAREVDSEDAAEAPQVPRVAMPARKRRNTGPRPVPLSTLHSYQGNTTATTSSFSLQAPTSRDKYDRFMPASRGAGSGPKTTHTTMTGRRASNPSQDNYIVPPPVVPDNFFDPAGTMRMEAFVEDSRGSEPLERIKTEPVKGKREARSYRTRQGRKKDLSYWDAAETAGGGGAEGAPLKDEDPFTGF